MRFGSIAAFAPMFAALVLASFVLAAPATAQPVPPAPGQPPTMSPNGNLEYNRIREQFQSRLANAGRNCDVREYFANLKRGADTQDFLRMRRDFLRATQVLQPTAERLRRAAVIEDLENADIELLRLYLLYHRKCGSQSFIDRTHRAIQAADLDGTTTRLRELDAHIVQVRRLRSVVRTLTRQGQQLADSSTVSLQELNQLVNHLNFNRQALAARMNLLRLHLEGGGTGPGPAASFDEEALAAGASSSWRPGDGVLAYAPASTAAAVPAGIDLCARDVSGFWRYPEYGDACTQLEPFLGEWVDDRFGGKINFYMEPAGTLGAQITELSNRMSRNGYADEMVILSGFQFAGVNGVAWSAWAQGGQYFMAKQPDRNEGQIFGTAEWIGGERTLIFIPASDTGQVELPPQLQLRLADAGTWRR